jgi:N-acetylneuraminate synthase
MTRAEVLQREVVAKSLICSSDINVGDVFSESNIEVKGPERGLSSQYFFDIIGRKSVRKIQRGDYLLKDDLKQVS